MKATLLPAPKRFKSVSGVLGYAGKMDLNNVLVLSLRPDGDPILLNYGLSVADAGFLMDAAKFFFMADFWAAEELDSGKAS